MGRKSLPARVRFGVLAALVMAGCESGSGPVGQPATTGPGPAPVPARDLRQTPGDAGTSTVPPSPPAQPAAPVPAKGTTYYLTLPEDPLPDLKLVNARFEANGPITFQSPGVIVVDVTNVGKAAVDEKSWAGGLITVMGPGASHAAVHGLKPGETKTVKIVNTVLLFRGSTARAKLFVDEGKQIRESNEENNQIEVQIAPPY